MLNTVTKTSPRPMCFTWENSPSFSALELLSIITYIWVLASLHMNVLHEDNFFILCYLMDFLLIACNSQRMKVHLPWLKQDSHHNTEDGICNVVNCDAALPLNVVDDLFLIQLICCILFGKHCMFWWFKMRGLYRVKCVNDITKYISFLDGRYTCKIFIRIALYSGCWKF